MFDSTPLACLLDLRAHVLERKRLGCLLVSSSSFWCFSSADLRAARRSHSLHTERKEKKKESHSKPVSSAEAEKESCGEYGVSVNQLLVSALFFVLSSEHTASVVHHFRILPPSSSSLLKITEIGVDAHLSTRVS